MNPDSYTSTAQWSLVIHRVSQQSVEVWVGTLFPALKMPERARVRLFREDREVRTRSIRKQDWQRPFPGMKQRFFTVVTFRGLEAGSDYRLAFERRIEADPRAGIKRRWQRLRSGAFRTLPSRVPEKGRNAFTIGLGSCFYNHRDGGRAAASYKALYERGSKTVRPDVTVLSGDQVYLDIGFDSLSLIKKEIRERIADDYALHWQALGSMLSRGGTWMLPDDHEYWNDYPFTDSLLPTLLALKLPHVRTHWRKAASDGVRNVQRSPVVESFTLGDDLSVCLADLRSYRSEHEFLPGAAFQRLLDWARHRACPGVLVLPQPLIVEQNTVERNLRSYGNPVCPVAGRVGLRVPRRRGPQRRRALRAHCQRPDRNPGRTPRRDHRIADVQFNRSQWTGHQRGHGQARPIPALHGRRGPGVAAPKGELLQEWRRQGSLLCPIPARPLAVGLPQGPDAGTCDDGKLLPPSRCRGHRNDGQRLVAASENKGGKYARQELHPQPFRTILT